MKHSRISKFIIAITLLFSSFLSLQAQESEEVSSPASYSIEVDPFAFLSNGYGTHFRYKPANTEHILIGVGAYAINIPSVLVDINKENKGEGWDVRLNRGYGIFLEYHLNRVHQGAFFGSQFNMQKYEIGKEAIENSVNYTTVGAMIYGGYSWQIASSNVYIKPWMGLGYSGKIDGVNVLEGEEYAISHLTPFATLHIGYSF